MQNLTFYGVILHCPSKGNPLFWAVLGVLLLYVHKHGNVVIFVILGQCVPITQLIGFLVCNCTPTMTTEVGYISWWFLRVVCWVLFGTPVDRMFQLTRFVVRCPNWSHYMLSLAFRFTVQFKVRKCLIWFSFLCTFSMWCCCVRWTWTNFFCSCPLFVLSFCQFPNCMKSEPHEQ